MGKIVLELDVMMAKRHMSLNELADKVGITEYSAKLLPRSKFNWIKKKIKNGDNVVYVGDGINGLVFPTGGIAMDFQLGSIPLFLGAGLNYMNYGYKWEYDWSYEGYSYSESGTEHAHSIQIPLTVSYHINVAPKMFVNPFVGPFFAYDLTDIDTKDTKWENDRFNWGFRIGCGMNFGRLTLDLGYDIGIKNHGNSDFKVRTGTFFATVGFNWLGSK